MTDWEKAIAYWLPDMWGPKQHCRGALKKNGDRYWSICPHGRMAGHDIACPSPSRDMAIRLLEAMGEYDDEQTRKGEALIEPELWRAEGKWHCRTNEWMETQTSKDLVEAIVKAAAALAKKEQP